VSRRGFLRPGEESELPAKWPLDALLVSNLSFSSSDEDIPADPIRYEALINGQLHKDIYIPSGRDVSILTWGGAGCLAPNCASPSTSLDLSTQLANLTPLSLPWLYRKHDHFTTMKVDSLHNVVPLGMQPSHLAHDWGLDLHNNIPHELPRKVVSDALVLSSQSFGSSSEMMVHSYDLHNCLDWPSL